MNQVAKIETGKARGLTSVMAEKFQMEPAAFVNAIKNTVMKGNVDEAQVAAFLMVAHEYDLNPLTKEIYAFPSNGGIQPIVSIDGWMKLINRHDQFDGMEFEDHLENDGKLNAVTCKIYRKDRGRPTEATEYMSECARGTEPWKKWPKRMLRHKAAIQCARYAFSFAMMDEDDFERMRDVTPTHNVVVDPLADSVEQAQISTESAPEEQETLSAGDTQEIIADPSTGEILDNATSADTPSAERAADADEASATEGGGEELASPPSDELLAATKAWFGYAKDAAERGVTKELIQQYRDNFEKLVPARKEKVPEREHDQLKSVMLAVDAVIKGEQEYETSVGFFADTMGFDPETFERTE